VTSRQNKRDYQRVEIVSRTGWHAWLKANHKQASSIWLVTYKKGNPRHVPYEAVVEEALCFGWVDSLPRKLDAHRSMLLLSPRRPGSAWSRPNKLRAERMIAAGRMTAAGLTKIDEAKRKNLWTKLDSVEALIVPKDLGAALKENPAAQVHWDQFPRSVKRGILEWIEQAKKPETRAKRVLETARQATKNQRANQWRKS
jgi:uncharacterized protein YdeI (YjbR/CyaY-like superfamily)